MAGGKAIFQEGFYSNRMKAVQIAMVQMSLPICLLKNIAVGDIVSG
ncbi:MAG: hypothetical protein FWH04_04360 [Oscillospiraceae bacterium]|nr:hypothetical protein [Oscillospiraceae bacterium]